MNCSPNNIPLNYNQRYSLHLWLGDRYFKFSCFIYIYIIYINLHRFQKRRPLAWILQILRGVPCSKESEMRSFHYIAKDCHDPPILLPAFLRCITCNGLIWTIANSLYT